MANGNQAAAKRLKMAERAQNQLDIHFPNIHQLWVWNRKRNDGWITIPRTLPIAMQAIDAQSKGAPAGHTLFCLWARCPDHVFMTIEHPATFAAEAGFTGVTFRNRCDESYCGTGLRPPDFANSCDDFSLNSCDGPVRISK